MLTVKDSQKNFFRMLGLFVAIITPWVLGYFILQKKSLPLPEGKVKLVNYERDTLPRVDHSRFAILNRPFNSPQEVTEACLSCHNKTAQDIMHTSHWTWTKDYITGEGDTIRLGKRNIINNFCVGVPSNEPRCTSCHIGYGYKDGHFDFNDERNIDCIICHDKTGTYRKFPTLAGYPVSEKKTMAGITYSPPDYVAIATHVGTPGIENCGACHFVGGGGNNVKHGDIAGELKKVTRDIDVHMAKDGARMECVECHSTHRHNISGNLYSIASLDTNRVSCSQCHSDQPHDNEVLDRHTQKVACQTCHIPVYAKQSPTKMHWDWSQAGKLNEDGTQIVVKDSAGNITYHSMKGAFEWKSQVEPDYFWFNGEASHYLLGEKVDNTNSVDLNKLHGSYHDEGSKIIPVKVHVALQPYDPVNELIILPHLFGNDSTSYWKNFDWKKAATTGMKNIDLPFSGEVDFIETRMYWPINHMVAPASESLQCADCHARHGRLESLPGFYLLGRDHHLLLDRIGWAVLLLSFLGVIIHGTLRITKSK